MSIDENQGIQASPEALAAPVAARAGVDFLMEVPVEISVELGRRTMRIADLLRLGPGSILELRKLTSDPLDIRVNEHLVARGEAVAVGDVYGIRIREVADAGEGERQ